MTRNAKVSDHIHISLSGRVVQGQRRPLIVPVLIVEVIFAKDAGKNNIKFLICEVDSTTALKSRRSSFSMGELGKDDRGGKS